MSTPPDKAMRKELRRLSNTRPSPASTYWPVNDGPMPGSPYLVAHACFKCRRSVKINVGHWPPRPARCPECAGKLHWLGRTFRTPKRSDIKQWKKIEILRQAGFLFHSHWGGALPDTLKEAQAFIVEQQAAALIRRQV
jgi:hypothetical protein